MALIDLLDRLLTGGVALSGEPVLSTADIGVVRISLRASGARHRSHRAL
ncbi:gas vesicle protein GvpA/GvpJ/GvpM family [Streptomyces puniciscabiei]|uniref:Gas vesicle protein GvpA/GvpJ/GvpM family n=1 Tax=Streptomyces puniciscabiei TaxID=164348 RepID=A0A542UDQ2_9ACTN|nr:gas vesicle protein GvpA/GvpJ/GvpM family [Streptomyces puniciscabiei]